VLEPMLEALTIKKRVEDEHQCSSSTIQRDNHLLIDSGVQGLECSELFSFQEAFQHGTD
jgi:hypothetical protein